MMNTQSDLLDEFLAPFTNAPLFHQALEEFLPDVLVYLSESGATEADFARLARLIEPERVVRFRVTWEDDAGRLRHNRGYRVQFSSALGPYKGGLRFDPSVTEDVLTFLGFEQIFKNALTGLPLGAGKGGSDFDPKGKSEAEIRRFTQAFMLELHRYIGADIDVPAGDIGVGGREIGYLYGMYKTLTKRSDGTLTGKSVRMGGACGRVEATGYGAVYFATEMLTHRGDVLAGKSAVVSGSGNVATNAARKLIAEGVTVKTLSDRGGYLLKPSGLTEADVSGIERAKANGQALAEVPVADATYLAGSVWGQVAAELHFPCATQNEIDEAAAGAMVTQGAQAVIEGANMPTTPAAAHRFKQAGVLFGPAKAVNAGGVAVSGLEMAQNAARVPWACEDIDHRLRAIMSHIHETCVQYGAQSDGSVDYAKGANIGGFVRVFSAMRELGW